MTASPEPGALGPPPLVAEAIRRRYGERGARWLDELPRLHAESAARWQLRISTTMTDGQMSSLLAAQTPDGTDVVLKCLPDRTLAARELEALMHWSGVRGVVDVLAADEDNGVLLLRRIHPGSTFEPGPGAAHAVAAVMGAVHALPAPRTSALPTLAAQIGGQLDKAADRVRLLPIMPVADFLELRELAAALSEPASGDVLLHGDMQPRNILAGPDGAPVLIDPRPSIGEPAFDAGTWALKQAPFEDASARARVIADALGLDAERVHGWVRILAAETALSRLHHGFCSEEDARRLVAVALPTART